MQGATGFGFCGDGPNESEPDEAVLHLTTLSPVVLSSSVIPTVFDSMNKMLLRTIVNDMPESLRRVAGLMW